jgi:hypothetical protein
MEPANWPSGEETSAYDVKTLTASYSVLFATSDFRSLVTVIAAETTK